MSGSPSDKQQRVHEPANVMGREDSRFMMVVSYGCVTMHRSHTIIEDLEIVRSDSITFIVFRIWVVISYRRADVFVNSSYGR